MPYFHLWPIRFYCAFPLYPIKDKIFSVEITTRCSFVIEFIIPNFKIINSITKLHLVGISTESSRMRGSMNIKFVGFSTR